MTSERGLSSIDVWTRLPDRTNDDLDPAVLLAALGGQVAGDRIILAPANGAHACGLHALFQQNTGHGLCPAG